MNGMNWLKGVVVAVGLSLGGSALAAGPTPVGFQQNESAGLYERRQHRGDDREWNDWNDRWMNDGYDRFDRRELRMFRLGQQKVADGRALQNRGEALLSRARWTHSPRLARTAHRLILRGEALEREGRRLIRRARS
jgi:hypothetical protein